MYIQVLGSFVHYLSSAAFFLLQKLVQRLNAMKLSVSSKTLKKLDSYGLKFVEKLKELQEVQARVISNPEEFKLEHTDGTFKIVLDNIDLRIATRDMTSDRQNKDIHWVNHSAVKNRVTLGSRKREQTITIIIGFAANPSWPRDNSA